MEADADTMYANGLYYDYANMTLNQVVEAFMADQGIESSQIAFSYKNTKTNEQFSMNDTQPMTAGSTYKLPLNMLVMDEVNRGKLSLTERFDINNTEYEYQGEHDKYVASFGGAMTIPEMQEYSLVYSENTPAYALAERLGGMENSMACLINTVSQKGKLKLFKCMVIRQQRIITSKSWITFGNTKRIIRIFSTILVSLSQMNTTKLIFLV